jgi:diguanylate cyclase (GGDEF)-like protein
MPDRATPLDHSEARFWLSTVAVGGWVTLLMVLAGALYTLLFAEQNRLWIGAIVVVVGVYGILALWVIPWRRVVAAGRMEAALLGWSVMTIGAVALTAALDGGAESPLAIALLLPAVFASLAYSLFRVALIAALAELAFLALVVESSPGAGFVLVFCSTLAGLAVMAVWQATFHQQWRRHLAQSSCTDPLTGLLNRRGLDGAAASAFSQLRRNRREVTLLIIDLDDFKAYNDTHGHQAGDELLRWVAARLQDTVRPSDSVARLGGDEFAVLLSETDLDTGESIVERIRENLEERVEHCLGWASAPEDGVTFDELYRVGDANLYQQKVFRQEEPADPANPDLAHRRSRRHFSADAILAGITQPFFVLDHDWRFAYVNQPASRLLDRAPHELLGQTIWNAYPEAVGSKFEQVYLQVAESGRPQRFTEHSPSGRTYSVMASPAPGGISVHFHEVTEDVRRAPSEGQASGEGDRLAGTA